MDKRLKYSFRQKYLTVQSIEKGEESITSAATRLGCSRSRIQQWLGHYRKQGKVGLRIRVENYSVAFRIRVVKYMLNKGLSLTETCSMFGIPNLSTVYRWLTIFKLQGIEGLQRLRRGRKRQCMARKKQGLKKDLTPEQQKLANLEAEVEYLRAENAFLKKLDALLREEQAPNKQKQGRKPSGN